MLLTFSSLAIKSNKMLWDYLLTLIVDRITKNTHLICSSTKHKNNYMYKVLRWWFSLSALWPHTSHLRLKSSTSLSSKVIVLNVRFLYSSHLFINLLDNILTEGRELVRILLSAGADPTAQDLYCRTALHTSAMVNDAELMKVVKHHRS